MFNHEYTTLNGLRFHYVTAGQGKLIMFLHGFPEFWYEWKNQLAEFGKDHLAVAPDLRGYNLSAKPSDVEQYQIHHLVEDIRQLADQLGSKQFTLVAHDWGGVVAWRFAMLHPEMLDKLIVVNAPHPLIFTREYRTNPDQQKGSEYMNLLRSPQAEALLSANNYALLSRFIFDEKLNFTKQDEQMYLDAWSQPGALTGGLNYYRAMRAVPATDDRSQFMVRVPTLVIWGEQDTALLTGNLNGLEQFVPDLTIKRIPDGSHWVIHEQPDKVNAYIRAFMA